MAKTNATVALVALLLLAGVAVWYTSSGEFNFGSTVAYHQQEATGTASTGNSVTQTVGSYPVQEVTMELRDKLNPKSGIPNVTVEVIPITGKESKTDLVKIASNPMRRKIDEGESNANGIVSFDSGRIFTGKTYLYAIRGDSDVYDRIVTYAIEPPAGITAPLSKYPIEEPVYLYRVGEFTNISSSDTVTIHLSGLSGPQYTEFDINLGESQPGKVIKNPVMVLKSPDDNKLPSGGIISLYIVKKSGSDLIDTSIASQDLVSWIDLSPIELKGTVPSDDGNVYMGVQDSSVYTVKLTFDADVVQPGNQLKIILDDLGDYAGQDEVTRDTKATPQILTIQFAS